VGDQPNVLVLALEQEVEQPRQGQGGQQVPRSPQMLEGLGLAVGQGDPQDAPPVRLTNASSRLARSIWSPLNGTPWRLSPRTSPSGSAVYKV
jgi:hypothetical protein